MRAWMPRSSISCVLEPRIVRHVRLGYELARRDQVQALPLVGVLAADARQVRPGALGAPLERTVVDGFARIRNCAIALCFEAQGADHLRMALIAGFAHIDVLAREAQRIVGLDSRRRFDGMRPGEQRHDLRQSAERHHDRDQYAEHACMLFDALQRSGFLVPCRHARAGSGGGTCCGTGSGIGSGIGTMIGLIWSRRASAAVCQRFHAITTIPPSTRAPPTKRIT